MGFFRTMYRELRDILGLSPPPENGTQRAARLCGELKGELGGKRQKSADNYALITAYGGRELTMLFEAEPSRARLAMASELDPGIVFYVQRDPLAGPSPAGRGVQRSYVATGVFLEAADPRALAAIEAQWKALPTGARGLIPQILQKNGGDLEVDGGVVRYTPEAATLEDKSAKYSLKSQLQTLQKIIEGMESGWGKG